MAAANLLWLPRCQLTNPNNLKQLKYVKCQKIKPLKPKIMPILRLFLFMFAYALQIDKIYADFSGFLTIMQYMNLIGKNVTTTPRPMTLSELGQSRGQCHYNYKDWAQQYSVYYCAADDLHIQHILQAQRPAASKPKILVKCLQPELTNNITSYDNAFLIMHSVKEIINLLKPIGNATKRHEPGSCVLVLFCTPSSVGCAKVAPFVNMLPYDFPTLRVAYIDAYRFANFNAEFGVVGLPTLLLFHQGRPVLKYHGGDEGSYQNFVTRHTGIKPAKNTPAMDKINNPLPLVPVEDRDYYLYLAWMFMIVCALNHLRRTNWWKQIVEMVQRNWRESEETQMEMINY